MGPNYGSVLGEFFNAAMGCAVIAVIVAAAVGVFAGWMIFGQ